MKLLNNLVAIIPDLPPEKTTSGIFLSSNSLKEWPPTGTVHEIGPLVTEVNRGEKVVYSAYAGVDLHLGKEDDYLIIPSDAIMAVLEESEVPRA